MDKDTIISLLKIDSTGLVTQTENEQLEFKAIFDRANKAAKAQYAKELAAMYNSSGGYLVFGISDDNKLCGLDNFAVPDSADIANDLNEYFKPVFTFRQFALSINGKNIFIIKVPKRDDIPTVCIRSFPDVINEGVIYCKYSSQAAPMHGEDLIHLLTSLKSLDSKKLTELESKKATIEYRPNLERGISGMQDGAIQFKLHNKGKRFKIKSIGTSNLNVRPYLFKQPPFFLEPDMDLAVKVYSQDGVHMTMKTYNVQFSVENELGEQYEIEIEGKGTSIQILEPLRV